MINSKDLYKKFLIEKKLDKTFLPYEKWRSIIKDHNEKIIDLIVCKAQIYEMNFNLGAITANEKKRKIRISQNGNYVTSINWPESLKRKSELIKEGKIPLEYNKNENLIVDDNGGEPWQIYNTSDTVVNFIWIRHKVKNEKGDVKYLIPKSRRYYLKMTIKNIKYLKRFKYKNDISYEKDAI